MRHTCLIDAIPPAPPSLVTPVLADPDVLVVVPVTVLSDFINEISRVQFETKPVEESIVGVTPPPATVAFV
jgi:hypothetical protein